MWRNQKAKLFHRKAVQLKPKDPSTRAELWKKRSLGGVPSRQTVLSVRYFNLHWVFSVTICIRPLYLLRKLHGQVDRLDGEQTGNLDIVSLSAPLPSTSHMNLGTMLYFVCNLTKTLILRPSDQTTTINMKWLHWTMTAKGLSIKHSLN